MSKKNKELTVAKLAGEYKKIDAISKAIQMCEEEVNGFDDLIVWSFASSVLGLEGTKKIHLQRKELQSVNKAINILKDKGIEYSSDLIYILSRDIMLSAQQALKSIKKTSVTH